LNKQEEIKRVPIGGLVDVNHCPICGRENDSTSTICYEHIITYDTDGNIIDWQPDCYIREAPYPKFVREQMALIDAHPEWGVKYL
jgi:hypothetical protein